MKTKSDPRFLFGRFAAEWSEIHETENRCDRFFAPSN